eukprot:ctg_225.g90
MPCSERDRGGSQRSPRSIIPWCREGYGAVDGMLGRRARSSCQRETVTESVRRIDGAPLGGRRTRRALAGHRPVPR